MADEISSERRVQLFERMVLMRRFEEMVIHVSADNTDIGRNHLYIGHEATGAAVMATLKAGDLTHTTHRNHGHLIARGADPGKALAEIMGREGGLNHGASRVPVHLGHGRRQYRALHRRRLCREGAWHR
jgi:TPP-dependent pyruvate/acetoin dehydrogenase alpha subunit